MARSNRSVMDREGARPDSSETTRSSLIGRDVSQVGWPEMPETLIRWVVRSYAVVARRSAVSLASASSIGLAQSKSVEARIAAERRIVRARPRRAARP